MKKILFPIVLLSFILAIISCGGDKNSSGTSKVIEETVEINGVNHFIKKIGEGEPLLVIHGGPGLFHDYLVPSFEKLSKDYQVIFYDQRGCGQSDFPADTSSITLDNFVSDLEAIRKHLKIEKLTLASHSWGALIALNYGKKYPDNLNKLILISPAPSTTEFFDETFNNMQSRRDEKDTKELVRIMMSREFEKRDEKTFKDAVMLGDKVNLVNQESVSELYKTVNFTKTTASNLLLVNSMMEQNFFQLDLAQGLEPIKCPTIIIYGDLDNVPFASAQYLQENITNAQMAVIKKSCHYPFFEATKEFSTIVKGFIDPEYE
jgi:proline iminopeptidase